MGVLVGVLVHVLLSEVVQDRVRVMRKGIVLEGWGRGRMGEWERCWTERVAGVAG